MTWFLRFILGLSPRIEDVKQIKKDFPELLSGKVSDRAYQSFLDFHIMIHGRKDMLIEGDIDSFVQNLKIWIKKSEEFNSNEDRLKMPTTGQNGCVGGRCIFSKNNTDEELATSEEPQILELMTVGGGLERKAPLNSFLDLTKKVHSGVKSIPKAIYITDPYLYVDVSEKGTAGGMINLKSYLEILNINRDSKFTLFTTNKPKKGNFKSFKTFFLTHFPNVDLKMFKTQNIFHDRFYIADYGKKGLKGLFGPSMNGLSDKDIVLIGELEPNTISFFKKTFDSK